MKQTNTMKTTTRSKSVGTILTTLLVLLSLGLFARVSVTTDGSSHESLTIRSIRDIMAFGIESK